MIHKRMQDKGITAYELAKSTEVVYETVRKILNGQQPPSKRLLREICSFLNLDFEQAYRTLVHQKLIQKHGREIAVLSKRNPELQPLEDSWLLLTTQQKQHVIWLVEKYVQDNSNPTQ